jgi:hypothetical protein
LRSAIGAVVVFRHKIGTSGFRRKEGMSSDLLETIWNDRLSIVTL